MLNLEIIQTIILILIIAILFYLKKEMKTITRPTNSGKRQVLVDTSVLIDGRILSLAKAGFIGDELLITRSVVGELQLLADSGDSEKRFRARYGLDIVTELQSLDDTRVTVFQDEIKTPEGVDTRLVTLAKELNALILTNDYNLNKVATIEGIRVLNINELAKNIRMEVLPGEKISLKLTQTGEGRDQAVGYLNDGTMVVVAKAKKYIGKIVEIEATRSIQTDAGRMLFADVVKVKRTRHVATKKPAKTNYKKLIRTPKKRR